MKFITTVIDTASPKPPKGSVLLVYTGGTLGMVRDEDGALVPFDFDNILDQMPILKNFALEITVISFQTPIDSSNILPKHWNCIGKIIFDNYDKYDGFVVLHGTDTMSYTASALSYMLKGLNKPVIFTGAQLPITSPRSDAHENLITALEIATKKEDGIPLVREVCVYFNYILLRGNRSKKVQSMHFSAFESQNYPELAHSGIMIEYNRPALKPYKEGAKLEFFEKFDNNVKVMKLFPGICEELIEAVLCMPGLKGVVLETYGSGNAPDSDWFIDCLERAIKKGIIILNVSQCIGGYVMQGRYGTSSRLDEIGVLSGNDITLEAAITKMMHLLAQDMTIENVKKLLVQPICGEMK